MQAGPPVEMRQRAARSGGARWRCTKGGRGGGALRVGRMLGGGGLFRPFRGARHIGDVDQVALGPADGQRPRPHRLRQRDATVHHRPTVKRKVQLATRDVDVDDAGAGGEWGTQQAAAQRRRLLVRRPEAAAAVAGIVRVCCHVDVARSHPDAPGLAGVGGVDGCGGIAHAEKHFAAASVLFGRLEAEGYCKPSGLDIWDSERQIAVLPYRIPPRVEYRIALVIALERGMNRPRSGDRLVAALVALHGRAAPNERRRSVRLSTSRAPDSLGACR